MTIKDVENSLYYGERVGDLPREKLLEIIGVLVDEQKMERENHEQTLRMLDMTVKGR